MIRKMAIAALILGGACLFFGVFEKVILQYNVANFSPAGFGQGALIFLVLSINLLLLDK